MPAQSILAHILLGSMVLLSGAALADSESRFSPTAHTETGPSLREAKTGMVWVWMPGGPFVYGCPGGDCLRADQGSALPPQGLHLPGFWMGRGRVTVAEYQACVTEGSCTAPSDQRWCNNAQPSSPVTCVDYPQAESFCGWIGGTLPTEQQWEFAADAGYEMNWEYGVDFNGHSHGATEWAIPSTPFYGGHMAARGGTEDMEPLYPSDRGSATPELQSGNIGFRCVRAPL